MWGLKSVIDVHPLSSWRLAWPRGFFLVCISACLLEAFPEKPLGQEEGRLRVGSNGLAMSLLGKF